MTLTVDIPETTVSLTMHLIYERNDGTHDVICAMWETPEDGDTVDMTAETRKVQ